MYSKLNLQVLDFFGWKVWYSLSDYVHKFLFCFFCLFVLLFCVFVFVVFFHPSGNGKHRNSRRRCPIKKPVLKSFANFTGNHKRDSSTSVFFCDFCEIFQNIFFTEHFQATASESICNNNLAPD